MGKSDLPGLLLFLVYFLFVWFTVLQVSVNQCRDLGIS